MSARMNQNGTTVAVEPTLKVVRWVSFLSSFIQYSPYFTHRFLQNRL